MYKSILVSAASLIALVAVIRGKMSLGEAFAITLGVGIAAAVS
jgi:hypothetical protein